MGSLDSTLWIVLKEPLTKDLDFLPAPCSPNSLRRDVMNSSKVAMFYSKEDLHQRTEHRKNQGETKTFNSFSSGEPVFKLTE